MWACGFFVARVPNATRPEMAGASAFFVVAFALPSYASLWRWAGRTRALQVLGALSAFALGIETLAVATGWPYGQFSYGDAIGGKVLGLVPWTVPFAWAPLVLGTYAVLHRARSLARPPQVLAQVLEGVLASPAGQVLGGALALVAADLVLDPGAVQQKFWAYTRPGLYYGVPASNYVGWLLSGVVGHLILLMLLQPKSTPASTAASTATGKETNPGEIPRVPAQAFDGLASAAEEDHREDRGDFPNFPPAALATSLAWTVAFWSSVCVWSGLWIPALLGHVALPCLWLVLRPGTGAGNRS